MSPNLPDLFELMLVNDPAKVIHIKLSKLDELIINNICFKNDKYLSRTQKKMLYQDAKLSALWELNLLRKMKNNGK